MFTEPNGRSLGALAEAAEHRFGDASSVVFEGATHTSAEIGALARRFATGLTALGARAGDRVAVCMAWSTTHARTCRPSSTRARCT